ncbi:MAG TPA: MMPL family transporter [Solirubrobacterales bacterium]|nr:MMPL family transporter [Solirubrobacterales bacterium]
MATFAGLAVRRRRTVLILFALVLVIAAPLAAKQSSQLTGGGFNDAGSQSAAVEKQLHDFRGAGGSTLAIVLEPQPGAGAADLSQAFRQVRSGVAGVDNASLDRASLLAARKIESGAPSPTFVVVHVDGSDGAATDVAKQLREEFGVTETSPGSAGSAFDVEVVGQGGLWAALQATSEHDVKTAEIRAFPAIGLVLLAVFGSLAAAVLPLALGAAALVVSGALIFLLSLAMDTSVIVSSVTSMLGLGVAIDYSLFLLVRYREEIAGGAPPEQALEATLRTSGVAVLFSGLTVMASLAGLFFIDTPALRSIAAGAIIVVAVSVLTAVTVLPTFIAMLSKRITEPGRLARFAKRRRRKDGEREAFWTRWSATVMRRPLVSALAAAALMLVLAAPALDLNIGNAGLRQIESGDPFRVAVTTVDRIAGPGATGPVQVVVSGAGPARLAATRRALAADPAVQAVAPPRFSGGGQEALLVATLRTDPTSEAARETVKRLREELPRAAGAAASVGIGGTTATIVDFDSLVGSSLWKVAVLICTLSFIALVPLLRSVVLPLKAVLMTMLSVLAAYGVTVAIFQWGWLGFLGFEKTPFIDTVTPPLVLVIAFGLSMDYEVFMLSRIRERYLATGNTRRAVAEGLASTGRTITSAAVIMVLVFLAFVSAGLPTVQRLGIALATAVALDATVVRLVLVPAAMALLDEWNWWLPGWLGRLLERRPGPEQPAPSLAAADEVES